MSPTFRICGIIQSLTYCFRVQISVIIPFLGNDTYFDLGYAAGYAKAGNASLTYVYHSHTDSEGNMQAVNYRAGKAGGCFTRGICGGVYVNDGHDQYYNWIKCTRCGFRKSTDHGSGGDTCYREVSSNAGYYIINCGKTESTIESAVITFE
mgnify:CR=1 FL=1